MDEQITVIFPECRKDELSAQLRRLTAALDVLGLADGDAGGFLGGEWGYATNYENDTFLIHRFCWCEQGDCLWCDGSSCRGDITREPHRVGCYQDRQQAYAREHGELLGVFDGREHWHVTHGDVKHRQFTKALCAEMGLSYPERSAVHCACGVDVEWRARYDACECDWHKGRGVYRFGSAKSAPHFWHKPTGLQVRWYKYIGRSMEVDGPDVDLALVFAECHASIGSVAGSA